MPDAGDDVRDVDVRGNVVDEVDEDADRADGEEDRAIDGEIGHEHRAEGLVPAVAHRSKDQDGIDEGRNEGAQGHLIAPVVHEIGQKPGPIGARGEDDGRHGHRKDRAGNPDHRTANGVQDRAGSIRLGGVEEGSPTKVLGSQLSIWIKTRARIAARIAMIVGTNQ